MNLRRLRLNSNIRDLVREHYVTKNDLIMPVFIKEGLDGKNEIPSMPGIYQFGENSFLDEVAECIDLGIKAVILFGIPKLKDSCGSDALDEEGLIARSVRKIKETFGDKIAVITDLCFCEFTDHGHCGIINPHLKTVDNDATLEISKKQAVIHAKAGADMIAPSGMMDGIVEALREGLDSEGFKHIPIMSYSTKFASAFYGPFRDAAESAPVESDYLPKDRKTYQMDVANAREALLESLIDQEEGADILMVKPALAFMDVIKTIKENTLKPLCVYNVSGEYSMVKAAAMNGWMNYEALMMEILTSFKRAGADMIISYHSKDAAKLIQN
ncbi:porphobilinogen synthase [Caminibacter pacificus]|jgi:porphobilinogen synthase|uniref:Delta-aminolevulinic acid dehydratase n=1 Tax=Caminibacter pacificus TaxID=1424653 RepID=A0AAJ4RDL2_9BACT|nr:porphobilinogen synthase [Caminibacter pacificus]QCI28657.1 porphobilinogen synthase [Caminibacter pacificus]ROR40614.1 porphobilinogen synthase [Caminibacter pacificus]